MDLYHQTQNLRSLLRQLVPSIENYDSSRLMGFIELIRPHNCFGASLAMLLGVYLVDGTAYLLSPAVMRAALVVWLIVAVGNVVNDYRDVAVDSLNKLHRPLPSGRVSSYAARCLALLLIPLALGVALTLSFWSFFIALVMVILSIGYSYYLKSTVLWGNGFVGLLAGTTVMFGGFISGKITFAVGIAASLIALFMFIREILKTVADQEGDALAGVRTVATYLGSDVALRLFQRLVVLLVVATALPWMLSIASLRYLYVMLISTMLPILGVAILLKLKTTCETLSLSLRITKLIWFFGLLSLSWLR